MRVFDIQKSAFDFGFGGPAVWSRRTRVTMFGKSIFFLMDDEGSKMQMVDIGFAPLIRLGVGVRPAQPASPLPSLREGNDFLSFHLLNLGISFSPQSKSKFRFWWGDRRLFYKGSRLATALTVAAALLVAGPAMAQHQGWDVERDGYVTTATTTKDSGEEGFSVSCDASAPYSDPYFTMWVGGGVGLGDPGSVLPADFSIDGRNTRSVMVVEEIDDYLVYKMVSPDITNALRSGRHLTVSIPSLGLRETFSLGGADDAIEQVLEGCN